MKTDKAVQPDSTTPQGGVESVYSSLKSYRRILLLTDGFSTPFLAKTAISLLRYRTDDIAGVFDVEHNGKDAYELFGTGQGVPVVDAIAPEVDAIFIGIAPPGGKLPFPWRAIIHEALTRGIDIVSGLHDFLTEDADLLKLAQQNNCRIIDVRKNKHKQTASGQPFPEKCLRIHTVGHDCSVGKMVVSIEVNNELKRRGLDSEFIATGQTGIMISGDGVPVDCVVSDFVNGAVEDLIRRHDHHDILLIEGQGSISHPSFSAVTLGLLHGCAPQGLIFCYEAGREQVKGLDNISLLQNQRLIEAYELNGSLRSPCRVIGIGVNCRKLSNSQAKDECKRVSDELELPACDVYRDGANLLADAVINFRKELGL